jgi:hypothetical protein
MRRPQLSICNSTGSPLRLQSEPIGLSYVIHCGQTFDIDVEGADETTRFWLDVLPGQVDVSVGGRFRDVVVYHNGEIVEYE